jgi:hypothetical protein
LSLAKINICFLNPKAIPSPQENSNSFIEIRSIYHKVYQFGVYDLRGFGSLLSHAIITIIILERFCHPKKKPWTH